MNDFLDGIGTASQLYRTLEPYLRTVEGDANVQGSSVRRVDALLEALPKGTVLSRGTIDRLGLDEVGTAYLVARQWQRSHWRLMRSDRSLATVLEHALATAQRLGVDAFPDWVVSIRDDRRSGDRLDVSLPRVDSRGPGLSIRRDHDSPVEVTHHGSDHHRISFTVVGDCDRRYDATFVRDQQGWCLRQVQMFNISISISIGNGPGSSATPHQVEGTALWPVSRVPAGLLYGCRDALVELRRPSTAESSLLIDLELAAPRYELLGHAEARRLLERWTSGDLSGVTGPAEKATLNRLARELGGSAQDA